MYNSYNNNYCLVTTINFHAKINSEFIVQCMNVFVCTEVCAK